MKAILSSSVAWICVATLVTVWVGACGGMTDGTGVDPDTFIGAAGTTGATAGAGGGTAGAAAAGMAGMAGGGAGTGAAGGPPEPDCDVVTEVFQGSSCNLAIACHGAGAEANGVLMNGTADEIGARMLDVESITGDCMGEYIDSQDPEGSLLLQKTSTAFSTVCNGAQNSRMPIGVPLTADKTECLQSWILWVASGAGP